MYACSVGFVTTEEQYVKYRKTTFLLEELNSVYYYILNYICVYLYWSLVITICFSIELSRDQVKLIEGELLMLRDEVERLTEEDARKKEQMKQMYETFSNEKSELKKCLETVSAHKQCYYSGNLINRSLNFLC